MILLYHIKADISYMDSKYEERFFTNDSGKKQYIYNMYNEEIHKTLKLAPNITLDFTTAFFNIQGWDLIYESLSDESISKIRILIGSEPSLKENVRGKTSEEYISENEIRKRNEVMLLTGRNDIEVSQNLYKLMNKFSVWLEKGISLNKIEIRLYNKAFLHGKTVHINSENYKTLLIGSANFTSAGLRKNREAVAKHDSQKVIYAANEWFDEAWEEALPYENKLLELYSSKVKIHDPKLIYMKFLESYFKDADLYKTYNDSLIENPWLANLAEFQRHGAIRAQECLDVYNGVLIADEVGLGKTYIAGSLIKKASMEGKGVLIVAPPAIANAVWEKYISTNELKRNVQLTTFDLLKRMKLLKGEALEPDRFNMIVIDEAHYIRNDTNQRYKAIAESVLPKMMNPQIVFLTATPINNSLMDIYNLLKLFIKDNFMRDKNIWSLEDEFYRKSNKSREPDKEDWRWIWFLLDKISVRRTREYIRSKYSEGGKASIMLDGEEWTFPTLKPPKRVEYGISNKQKHLVENVIKALQFEEGGKFKLAAYDIYSYMNNKPDNAPPTLSLVGTTLLKRLESSMEAFRSTCEILLGRTNQRLTEANELIAVKLLHEDNTAYSNDKDELYNNDYNEVSEELADDTDENEQDPNGEVSKTKEIKKAQLVLSHEDFDDECLANFIDALNEDKKILESWLRESIEASIEDNFKVIELLKLISKTGNNNPNKEDGNSRKMVIFTSSAKTAEWLEKSIVDGINKLSREPEFSGLSYYSNEGKVASVTGGSKDKEEKLKAFAPNSMNNIKGNNDDYGTCDIIIATDVLAEGVNLQQAGMVINYDLPWNPMRVVQRVGRIDRIMSQHDVIFNYCFFPKADIFQDYLSLYAKLKYKMTLALNTMGERDVIGVIESSESDAPVRIGIFGSDSKKETFEDGVEEIAQQLALNNGQSIASVDLGDLEVIKEWYIDYERASTALEELPMAAGSVFRSDRHDEDAWVFCARIIKDNLPKGFSTVRFIIVKESDPTRRGYVDTLESLSIADPRVQDWLNDKNNLQTVSEEKDYEQFNNLFDIWKSASKSIAGDWNANINSQTSRNKTKVKLPARIVELIAKDLNNNSHKFSKDEIEYILVVINSELLGYQIASIESIYSEYDSDKKNYEANKSEIEANILGGLADMGKRYLERPLSKRIFEHLTKNVIHPNNEKIEDITADDIELIAWVRVLPKIYNSSSPSELEDKKPSDVYSEINVGNPIPSPLTVAGSVKPSSIHLVAKPKESTNSTNSNNGNPESNVNNDYTKERHIYKPRDSRIEEKLKGNSELLEKLNKMRNGENNE